MGNRVKPNPPVSRITSIPPRRNKPPRLKTTAAITEASKTGNARRFSRSNRRHPITPPNTPSAQNATAHDGNDSKYSRCCGGNRLMTASTFIWVSMKDTTPIELHRPPTIPINHKCHGLPGVVAPCASNMVSCSVVFGCRDLKVRHSGRGPLCGEHEVGDRSGGLHTGERFERARELTAVYDRP